MNRDLQHNKFRGSLETLGKLTTLESLCVGVGFKICIFCLLSVREQTETSFWVGRLKRGSSAWLRLLTKCFVCWFIWSGLLYSGKLVTTISLERLKSSAISRSSINCASNRVYKFCLHGHGNESIFFPPRPSLKPNSRRNK